MAQTLGIHRLARGDTGRTVVFCHPAPGAGTLDPDPRSTAARGVSLLAVDRPGYGESAPAPQDEWATVDRAAEQLAGVLERERTGPVGVVGWDAGGWSALALAALHPDLVDRLVLVATPAPHSALPWISADVRATLEALATASPLEARRRISGLFSGRLPTRGADEAVLDLLSRTAADEPALSVEGNRGRLHAMLDAAFAQGVDGYAADVAGSALRPWGFRFEEVRAKTLLLFGAKDPVCASRHGRWWRQQLPDARLEMSPGRGHLLVFAVWPRVLAHLAPGLRRAP